MAEQDSSELSSVDSLSPPPPELDEFELNSDRQGILNYFSKLGPSAAADMTQFPPPRKRKHSPPHEAVFADNPDVAFIVMFRKRFDAAMPRSLAHFGPIEVEQDVQQDPPNERLEHFLCVVLGLLLNRKQDIKIGHYSKALNEDAINGKDFKPQWPKHWNNTSPLAGGANFHTLNPDRRLDLLKQLTLWSLGHSDAIKAIINANYSGKRATDDLNQPLSVQPWGVDSDKRRYYLIEGDENCSFRVYRESNPAGLYSRQWISVAGNIGEVKKLADKLAILDGGPYARKLSKNILKNIVNFEEKEEKRKRRDYRRQQKEKFRRPEPGFSLYEGRTRGKRVKYNYSDDEDFNTDSTNRRSTRNTRNPTPAEAVPVVTASGRQSRPPARLNADTLSNGDASVATTIQEDSVDVEMSEASRMGLNGRPRRSVAVGQGTDGWAQLPKGNDEYMSDEEGENGDEPDYGDYEEDDNVHQEEMEDEEEFEDDNIDVKTQDVAGISPRSNDSRMVKLSIKVAIDNNGKVRRLTNDGSTPPTLMGAAN